MSAELIDVAPGVVRVSWTPELQSRGLGESSREVRGAVERAFKGGSTRVETHVDPDDADGPADRHVLRADARGRRSRRGHRGRRRVRPDRLRAARGRRTPGGPEGLPLAAELLPPPQAGDQPDADPLHRRPGAAVPAHLQARPRPARRRRRGQRVARSSRWPARCRRSSPSPSPPVRLLLTDWLPPWGGWDDAVCLVFDGGVHDPSVVDDIVRQEREIRSAGFFTVAEARERCADFTARRIEAALRNLSDHPGPAYTESGRGLPG